ncbi:glycosyltransferase family 1 protein [Nostoc sp. FACHB-152]|uniref:glycosyltransferase family 1 protein n=1 Tax=unclassified Nostoc TaxID=2593658 RepID=UPI00168A3223|nr:MULTISPECIES: glycosyltransferase family 1 protein [unclassified Nostoc]MBD2451090.1 glycosyltransferase family 1 protein [Nostoc sp. FACHB-152]MBD2472594.1 glycosyltransferase family 1 protein [Nostoc sp. FACHB-145]
MIIQIVPQMPPVTNGVSDYATILAKKLRENFGISTCFVVGDPTWDGATEIDNFQVYKVNERSAKALVSVLEEIASSSPKILLQYVGYGYAPRGCPFWLVDGLQQWQKRTNKGTLVTMFHELYATGYPIWSSAFWTEPIQKYLVARLVNMSDRSITNKPEYANILNKFNTVKNAQIPILPVFSNVGEPEKIKPLSERKPRLVIFGGAGNRLKVYEQSTNYLKRVCQELDIQEIIDIGTQIKLPISEINLIPIVSLGQQSAEKVSEILQDSLVGFFYYPLDFLTRSGTFAAYCAHGVIPVCTTYYAWGKEQDGLEENKHYFLADNQSQQLSLSLGEAIAQNAYNWYQTHNLARQAQIYSEILK